MSEYNNANMVAETEGISLQELFKIIWHNIAMIVIITMWTIILGVVYTFVIVKPTYTANTSIIVQVDPETSGTNEQSAIVIANNLIGTFKEYIVSDKVLTTVIADIPELENVSLSSLKKSISVSTTTQVLIFKVSIKNASPYLAAKIANTLVQNAIEIADNNSDPYIFLKNKLKVLDMASIPTQPSAPNKLLNIAISALLGGVIALAVVFLKEYLSNRYKNVDELERHLNVKVLAAVPGTIKERKLVD